MKNVCGICKEDASIEHTVACGHGFCYLCIRRHLLQNSFCPVCYEGPYTVRDLLPLHVPNKLHGGKMNVDDEFGVIERLCRLKEYIRSTGRDGE